MSVKVIGLGYREYTNKQNKQVKGYNVYVASQRQNVEGVVAENIWVRPEIVQNLNLKVGDQVVVYYNRYGSVEDIKLVK